MCNRDHGVSMVSPGERIKDLPAAEASHLLSGTLNSTVTVTVLRGQGPSASSHTVALVRLIKFITLSTHNVHTYLAHIWHIFGTYLGQCPHIFGFYQSNNKVKKENTQTHAHTHIHTHARAHTGSWRVNRRCSPNRCWSRRYAMARRQRFTRWCHAHPRSRIHARTLYHVICFAWCWRFQGDDAMPTAFCFVKCNRGEKQSLQVWSRNHQRWPADLHLFYPLFFSCLQCKYEESSPFQTLNSSSKKVVLFRPLIPVFFCS